ncbi:hypothetical protein FDUTEX481_02694 [Tolypothrix sp. PCC 7601]|nr:hypothetical protein FDUTEX481_02694 [Tolypothrix sp. PCC 7601]
MFFWNNLFSGSPLDPDVESVLLTLELSNGSVLDLGTGPLTQAIAFPSSSSQLIFTSPSF